MDRAEVVEYAKQIVARRGGVSAVARLLGKHQPSVSQALNDTSPRRDGIRREILRLEGKELKDTFELIDIGDAADS